MKYQTSNLQPQQSPRVISVRGRVSFVLFAGQLVVVFRAVNSESRKAIRRKIDFLALAPCHDVNSFVFQFCNRIPLPLKKFPKQEI